MQALEEISNRHGVEDIVLSPRGVFTYENGQWHKEENCSISLSELWDFSRQLAENASLSLGLLQPSADSYWMDSKGKHFRAHVAIHPLVLKGPEITLRRIPVVENLAFEAFNLNMDQIEKIKEALFQGKNFLISGATGSGKTSFLSILLCQLPSNLRMVILEDSPELSVPNPFSTKMLSRQDRFGFRNGAEWNLEDLVFESLRMRPDRIVLGECRGKEAKAIYSASQTGHKGIMTSIHAGSCLEALERFKMLATGAGLDKNLVASPLWEVIIHICQKKNGQRHVDEIIFQ